MAKRQKKGRLNLLEALCLLEATLSRGYPDDGTGVAGDDDRPPGNIVYGNKYKRTEYFNKLTDYQDSWEVDAGDWDWDEFENTTGMEDFDNYSNTLKGMEDLFPKETWKNVWKRMKHVPDDKVTLGFKQAGQPWRKGGEDQLGVEKETYVDVETDDDGSFKDADVTNENIEKKIDDFIL